MLRLKLCLVSVPMLLALLGCGSEETQPLSPQMQRPGATKPLESATDSASEFNKTASGESPKSFADLNEPAISNQVSANGQTSTSTSEGGTATASTDGSQTSTSTSGDGIATASTSDGSGPAIACSDGSGYSGDSEEECAQIFKDLGIAFPF